MAHCVWWGLDHASVLQPLRCEPTEAGPPQWARRLNHCRGRQAAPVATPSHDRVRHLQETRRHCSIQYWRRIPSSSRAFDEKGQTPSHLLLNPSLWYRVLPGWDDEWKWLLFNRQSGTQRRLNLSSQAYQPAPTTRTTSDEYVKMQVPARQFTDHATVTLAAPVL
ncbi:uncharacterized protein B0I36DRAFT_107120 [Microdochium trichocladiopsis]|uniref:Uncharacterized protein n=1 Tax=Microdochium trichocladiopsis TaxID=1682393 RepID=A0A9P8Y9X6_9PEZI|nr:uncharacterized protein B0I36DRAFT_107120 [Microdochium trichocladiopsis]KAH7033286.1 hypothetical protein B0I36DRAFT_107120 [Microdochium trichocladiopsis]